MRKWSLLLGRITVGRERQETRSGWRLLTDMGAITMIALIIIFLIKVATNFILIA